MDNHHRDTHSILVNSNSNSIHHSNIRSIHSNIIRNRTVSNQHKLSWSRELTRHQLHKDIILTTALMMQCVVVWLVCGPGCAVASCISQRFKQHLPTFCQQQLVQR